MIRVCQKNCQRNKVVWKFHGSPFMEVFLYMCVWVSLGFSGLCHSLNWTVVCRWSCSYLTAICCRQRSVWGCASRHSIRTCLILQFSPYEHIPRLNWMPASFPPDPAWWPASICACKRLPLLSPSAALCTDDVTDPHENLATACQCQCSWSNSSTEAHRCLSVTMPVLAV